MLKLLISLSLFFTLSNATVYSTGIKFTQNPIEKITDPNYCYQRSLIHHELLSYTPYSHGSDTYGYHCEVFHASPSESHSKICVIELNGCQSGVLVSICPSFRK